VADAATTAGATCYVRDDLAPSVDRLLAGVYPSRWIACAAEVASLGDIPDDQRWHQLRGSSADAWTDDRIPIRIDLG
jgi:hypothetical protein